MPCEKKVREKQDTPGRTLVAPLHPGAPHTAMQWLWRRGVRSVLGCKNAKSIVDICPKRAWTLAPKVRKIGDPFCPFVHAIFGPNPRGRGGKTSTRILAQNRVDARVKTHAAIWATPHEFLGLLVNPGSKSAWTRGQNACPNLVQNRVDVVAKRPRAFGPKIAWTKGQNGSPIFTIFPKKICPNF